MTPENLLNLAATSDPLRSELRFTHVPLDQKLYLCLGRDVQTVSGTIALRGYLKESVLGARAQWKRFPAEVCEAKERTLREREEPRLIEALDSAALAITEFLATCAEERREPKLQILKVRWRSGETELAVIPMALEQSLADLRAKQRHKLLAAQIGHSVKLSDYPDTFRARRKPRRLIAVLGGTNSGKTYSAFERLATAASGLYLGPLRLLALEAFTRLNEEFGVTASLITGEERRLVVGSRVTASTIEMLDPSQDCEVAVVDEIQMLNDPDRGWAWTQAVVGANADEVWLLGAPSAEGAIKALAERLGLPLEIRRTERKHPLVVGEPLAAQPAAALRKAKPGDAFIVFSRRDALNLRDDLLALGKTVACVYGALSPEVREREARRFATGDAEIIVATDAIGLGLNLPVARIIFTSVQKFDGQTRGDLTVPLLQQIAGRAGRFGHVVDAGIVCGLTPVEQRLVTKTMGVKQWPIPSRGFQITAGTAYLEQIATMAGDDRLEALLSLFQLHADAGDGFFAPFIPEEQLARAALLDRFKGMSLGLKHIFSMAPMSSRDEAMDSAWQSWAYAAYKNQPVTLAFLPKSPDKATLAEAETTVRLLAAYRWLGYRLPELFTEYSHAEQVLAPWISAVDNHLRSKRRQGQGGGYGKLPSWYWRHQSGD